MEQNRSRFENDPIPAHIHKAIEKAEHLGDERLWGRAYEILVSVNAELHELGVESCFVAWLLAVASDTIGRLEEAITYIARALALDLRFNRVVTSERLSWATFLPSRCRRPPDACPGNFLGEFHPSALSIGPPRTPPRRGEAGRIGSRQRLHSRARCGIDRAAAHPGNTRLLSRSADDGP